MGDVVPFPARQQADGHDARDLLWRELVGDELRQERRARGERLTDVAERAGVSTQYLSEVERGLKDPSSEMLHAIAGALELTVRQVASRASRSPGAQCLAA